MPKGYHKGRLEAAAKIAHERGVSEAFRATGIPIRVLETFIQDLPAPEPQTILVDTSYATELVELDPNEVIDGLPARGTRAYIDQHVIARRAAAQAAYVSARRGELRVKMVDTAHVLVDRLKDAESGNDAKAWAIALGIAFDKVRLDSGQVTDLRGVAVLRGDLDDEQRREWSAAKDLSTPVGVIEATSEEILPEEVDTPETGG